MRVNKMYDPKYHDHWTNMAFIAVKKLEKDRLMNARKRKTILFILLSVPFCFCLVWSLLESRNLFFFLFLSFFNEKNLARPELNLWVLIFVW